ncbi:putative phospholipase A2 domain-containing protein [Rosa chinensis]|uniref:Putative phospholipase A2 domain-containing protein n=1 Tax=Rosa chinensis TaxID=74649 RepID=A0A2P6QF45_ROSCH|nr:uncharacterized protein LOC112167765 [Rosa chinensis]XP_024160604.1 uncharacterized protein LOC112167765 [Rosa chinensis]XP_024160606.1 uncharacterized protein LOC112167765 [Rosa chinensis]PRQ32804.1 putative phospholipase A2 domain-containing protein [Rosa chinensis]
MNFGFLGNLLWFRAHQSNSHLKPTSSVLVEQPERAHQSNSHLKSTSSVFVEQPEHKAGFDLKLLVSFFPWVAVDSKHKSRTPSTINRQLRRRAQPHAKVAPNNFLRFRPYVSRVPWHTGVRGFLSQLFPRYGHYCGPNFSSGKDGGSLVWDKRPIDWLDFCCYCHDIGYDTHDQAELLKADLAFLECLEKPNMSTKGDAGVALLYKTMCTTGLRNFLIPYRTHLVKLTSGQPLIQFGWLSNVRWRGWSFQKT